MGLLDELLGGLAQGGLGQAMGQPQPQQPRGGGMPGPMGAGMGGAGGNMSGILMALLPVVLAMMSGRQGGGGQGAGMGGMGDLGGLLGSILGGGRGGAGGTGGTGGLGGLLEQFQRMGYGEQANSWVGTGQNLPISPEVIAQIFGRDGLSQIATQAGLSEADASAGLSQLLPGVVDKLTPQGEMPDLDVLAQSVQDLQRRLG